MTQSSSDELEAAAWMSSDGRAWTPSARSRTDDVWTRPPMGSTRSRRSPRSKASGRRRSSALGEDAVSEGAPPGRRQPDDLGGRRRAGSIAVGPDRRPRVGVDGSASGSGVPELTVAPTGRHADPAIRREGLGHLAEGRRQDRPPGAPDRPRARPRPAARAVPSAGRSRRGRRPAAARRRARASTRRRAAGSARRIGATGPRGGRRTTAASSRAIGPTRTGPPGPSAASR